MKFCKWLLLGLLTFCSWGYPSTGSTNPEGRCAIGVNEKDSSPFPNPRHPDAFVDAAGDIAIAATHIPVSAENFEIADRWGYQLYHTHMETGEGHPRTEWEHPLKRGVFDLKATMNNVRQKRGRNLQEAIQNLGYRVTFNHDFERVLRSCATMKRYVKVQFDPTKPDDPKYPPAHLRNDIVLKQRWYWAQDASGNQVELKTTWLTEEIIQTYLESYRRGHAISTEVWNPQGELVGGTFGTLTDNVYSGWSIFHHESKGDLAGMVALIAILWELEKAGYEWVDTQEIKAGKLSQILGGIWVDRNRYMDIIDSERAKHLHLQLPQGEVNLMPLFAKHALYTMTPQQLERFRDPRRGTLRRLELMARTLGKDFNTKYGIRELLLYLAYPPRDVVRDDAMKRRLTSVTGRIKNILWQPDDGKKALKDDAAASRIYQGLYAHIYAVDPPVNIQRPEDAEELFAALGWKVPESKSPFELSPWGEDTLAAFRDPAIGTLAPLQHLARNLADGQSGSLPIEQLLEHHFIGRGIHRGLASSRMDSARAHLLRIPWKPNDLEAAATDEDAVSRVVQGLSVLIYNAGLDSRLVKLESAQEFFGTMGLSVVEGRLVER